MSADVSPLTPMQRNLLTTLLGLTTTAVMSTAFLPTAAIATTLQVESGVTSVFLDLELLQSIGLSLTGTSDDLAEPASDDFLVGFNITPETNFKFSTDDGFAPVSGSIEHLGSITFNDQITVGNLSIGFDPARATGQASGFFVKDTLDTIGAVLFDVAAPDTLAADDSTLTLGANLLVSPEFAGVLGNADLTGAVVGKAQTNATTATATADVPEPASMLAVLASGAAIVATRRRTGRLI